MIFVQKGPIGTPETTKAQMAGDKTYNKLQIYNTSITAVEKM